MADLGTILFGTYDSGSSSFVPGGFGSPEPYLESIAGTDDTDGIQDSQNSTHDAVGYFAIGDMPSDFQSMLTLSIRIRYSSADYSNNSWGLYAGIRKSGLGINLVTERLIASGGNTAGILNSSVFAFSGIDTAATKEDWDGAVLRLRLAVSRSKGGDSTAVNSIYAGELTGTYTVAAGSLIWKPQNYIQNFLVR